MPSSATRYLLFFFLLCFSIRLSAQKEHSVWHFGSGAGIRFLDDTVISINGGNINSREGCASVSGRKNGALLFYTDGTKIWNRNHSVMPNGNGLLGNYSSAQSALVIPFPNDTNKYYVFTTHTGTGMYYSVVDMALNGGLGDIPSGSKNINLIGTNSSSEKLTGTKHCNDTDYWVITHLVNGNNFYVYKVSASGISTPSIYSVGSSFTVGGWNEAAQMKISIDGKKLANAIGPFFAGGPSSVQLFDFNNATGQISSPTATITGFSFAYGVEFSPSGQYLYVTELAAGKLDQFDLNASNIAASKTVLASSSTLLYGGLQIGPDGRIYVSAENGYNVPYRYLSIIRYPDRAGNEATFQANHVDLGSNGTLIGLPTLFASNELIRPRITGPKLVCAGSTGIGYKLKYYGSGNTSWQLKSQGSTSISSNTDTSAQLSFRSTPGFDTLIISHPVGCGSFAHDSFPIQVIYNNFSLGRDTALCIGGITLDAGIPNARYSWNNSSFDTFQTKYVINPGTYWVKVTDLCRDIYDTIIVGPPDTVPQPFIGNDTLYCNDFFRLLSAGSTGYRYQWSTGANDSFPSISISNPGIYWVRASSKCQSKSDTINIQKSSIIKPWLGNDSTLCSPLSLNLNSGLSGYSFQWSTGPADTLSQLQINSPGIYWLRITNQCGSLSDTINISEATAIQDFDLADSILCGNDSILLLVPEAGGMKYQWSTGAADTLQGKLVNTPGFYWVTVSGPCNSQTDTILIRNGSLAQLPPFPDTSICGVIEYSVSIPNIFDVQWNDGDTSHSRPFLGAGIYIAVMSNACGTKTDTMVIDFSASNPKALIPNAFTPGADNLNPRFPFNDTMMVAGLEKYSVQIYNRWGELVFLSNRSSYNWDGMYRSKEAEEGVYYYIVSYRDCSRKFRIQSGVVHLIR